MKITITEQQFNGLNIIYTGVFFNKDEVMGRYPSEHPNKFSHHVTIEFKPKDSSNVPFGERKEIKVIGRLTTDKVDALLVDCPLSKNEHPHITLATAEGIKPFMSNKEIQNNPNMIEPLNDSIVGTFGFFDGSKIVTDVSYI